MPGPCTVCSSAEWISYIKPTPLCLRLGCYSSSSKTLAAEVAWEAVEEGGRVESAAGCRGSEGRAGMRQLLQGPSPALPWNMGHAGHLTTVLWYWQWAGR